MAGGLGRYLLCDQYQADNKCGRHYSAYQHKRNDAFLLKVSLAVFIALHADKSREGTQNDIEPRGLSRRF